MRQPGYSVIRSFFKLIIFSGFAPICSLRLTDLDALTYRRQITLIRCYRLFVKNIDVNYQHDPNMFTYGVDRK